MIKRNIKYFVSQLNVKCLAVVLLFAILPGCGDGTMVVLGPQQWQDLEFRVEVHPSPPRAGMTEFIVIASREVYKPGVGLVVDIRVDENAKWIQAIQDGFTGVYRRAVNITDPQTQSLWVRVKRTNKDEEMLLSFPLKQEPLKQEALKQEPVTPVER